MLLDKAKRPSQIPGVYPSKSEVEIMVKVIQMDLS